MRFRVKNLVYIASFKMSGSENFPNIKATQKAKNLYIPGILRENDEYEKKRERMYGSGGIGLLII